MGELKRAISANSSISLAASIASSTATSVAAPGIANIIDDPDYVNPLDSSSRWYLNARASTVRYAASLGFSIHHRAGPPAPVHSREIWLDSTLSQWKGSQKIKVEIWIPPRIAVGTRPAVINFHGGGWILGQGTDDARWAGAVMSALDAVVFTVNYRLAPSYPFPVATEDCIDALMQIADRSTEFGIDPDRIILSGFSAGATLALGMWDVLQEPARFNYELPKPPPNVCGLVLFYPTLDITISRPQKRQGCSRPHLTLSPALTDLIDASYVYPPMPREMRTDSRLSPGLMSDEHVKKLPPVHLCLCEYDMLLHEGLRFAQRMEYHEKTVSVRVVEGESHGWDKPPPLAPKDSVFVEYGEATQAVARWLGRKCEEDGASNKSKGSRKLQIRRRPSYFSFRSRSSR